jgi:hypothetical protein
MRSGFASAHESQALKQTDRPIESDDSQAQRLVREDGFALQATDQKRTDSGVPVRRQQRYVNAANFMIASLNNQATRRVAVPQDYLIVSPWVFALVETSLRLVLHVEKLADAISIPAELAQVVATVAPEHFEQELLVVGSSRSQANRVVQIDHVRDSSRTSLEFKFHSRHSISKVT